MHIDTKGSDQQMGSTQPTVMHACFIKHVDPCDYWMALNWGGDKTRILTFIICSITAVEPIFIPSISCRILVNSTDQCS